MTLALALAPLAALLSVAGGLTVLPILGLLTAVSVVTLHHLNQDLNAARMLFVAAVALAISVIPTWKLNDYTEESRTPGTLAALSLALFLGFTVCASLPAEEAVRISSVMPVNPSAITTSLMIIFTGLAALALRTGIKYQFAGLLTACNGILLAAANAPQTRAVWIVGGSILLLVTTCLWLAQRLSLLRSDSDF